MRKVFRPKQAMVAGKLRPEPGSTSGPRSPGSPRPRKKVKPKKAKPRRPRPTGY